MADEHHGDQHHRHLEGKSGEYESLAAIKAEEVVVETADQGLFDFTERKKEECEEEKKKPPYVMVEEEVIVTEFEKIQVSEPKRMIEGNTDQEEKKHGTLLEKLHRSGSSSSSSSSDEEGGEKENEKKKELKDKILEEEKEEKLEAISVPIEKCEEDTAAAQPEEKKGFLEKIKEKLQWGQHKKAEKAVVSTPQPQPPVVIECYSAADDEGDQPKEKKGFFEKMKEKIPGYHPKTSHTEDEDNEKEN